MASSKKPVGSLGASASKKSTSKPVGSPQPSPRAAAIRDFRTGKTGMGSGGRPGVTSSWQKQYNTEMSRLKRTKATTSGMGSGKPSKDGSEGPKRQSKKLPNSK